MDIYKYKYIKYKKKYINKKVLLKGGKNIFSLLDRTNYDDIILRKHYEQILNILKKKKLNTRNIKIIYYNDNVLCTISSIKDRKRSIKFVLINLKNSTLKIIDDNLENMKFVSFSNIFKINNQDYILLQFEINESSKKKKYYLYNLDNNFKIEINTFDNQLKCDNIICSYHNNTLIILSITSVSNMKFIIIQLYKDYELYKHFINTVYTDNYLYNCLFFVKNNNIYAISNNNDFKMLYIHKMIFNEYNIKLIEDDFESKELKEITKLIKKSDNKEEEYKLLNSYIEKKELAKNNLFIQIGYVNNQFQNENSNIYIDGISLDEKKIKIKIVSDDEDNIENKELDINLLFCLNKNKYPTQISKSTSDKFSNIKIGYIEDFNNSEDNYKIIKINHNKVYNYNQKYIFYMC